jgi:hypothetical protein
MRTAALRSKIAPKDAAKLAGKKVDTKMHLTTVEKRP